MPLRSILLIGLAIVFAGATAMIARSMLSGSAPPPQEVATPEPETPKTRILVASETLGLGRILKEGDLRWQSWPDDDVHDGYLEESDVSAEDYLGHVVRYTIAGGEPVSRSNLIEPGTRGFLAAALTPGMRAVTVRINEVSGISGFIFPGDRVDLILNHRIEAEQGGNRNVSETVVRNLRVLAVDTRTAPMPDGDGAAQPQIAKTVTLEATPRIAEKVSLAKQMGEIALTLRSLASDDTEAAGESGEQEGRPLDDLITATWDADVSGVLPPVDRAQAQTEVKLTRGSEVSVVEFPKDPGL